MSRLGDADGQTHAARAALRRLGPCTHPDNGPRRGRRQRPDRRTLARAGWHVSAETVRRIRRERPVATPTDPRGAGVIARHPNHVWLIELTTIRGLVGPVASTLACVYGAFARLPLVWRVVNVVLDGGLADGKGHSDLFV